MFAILLAPLNAFCGLVARNTKLSLIAGLVLGVLAVLTHHEAWASVMAMFVGFVLIWMSEVTNPHRAEQGTVAGD
ncbi:hypothetical protein [Falsiroseomonas tokyonensis]|uniref:Uncharacterized protein n=1 Tax=Falsiroseomonas tokyonensis TaxID=430521 RepID=A0ABV7BYL2_9PROT|nr:hypothetical protein [Falsiroseomonas tokyonensis]MBU8540080.1 hypothetical protein [Falsiroseomonas tokyonensis]